MRFSYDSLGNAVAILYNGTEYYYMRNLQGDVIGLMNKNGEWVVRYRYDVWGNVLEVSGIRASTLGQDNPFRYRGYYYDIETELYYIGSRYYNTEMCRFICPDKTSVLYAEPMKLTSKNLYSYCDNNPVSKTDLNGEIGIAATILGSVALNLGTYVLSTAILNAAGVEDAEISATGVACAIVSGVAAGATAAAVTALALKGGAKMAATLFASTVDSVCAAISTLIDTGNYGYAIFSGMASAAFSLGSLPGMMSLLDIEEYIPAVERTMLEVYVGTSKNTVIDYTMSGTSSGGKTNSGTSRSNSNKSNWPIVQSKTNSKGFDMTSILLPSTREQMKDFHNKILAVY